MVWQIVGEVYWDPWVYIEENIYGIRENHIPMLRSVVEAIVRWTIQKIGCSVYMELRLVHNYIISGLRLCY